MDPNHVTIGSAVFIFLALLGFWRSLDGKIGALDEKLSREIKELYSKLDTIREDYHEQDKRIHSLEIIERELNEPMRRRND